MRCLSPRVRLTRMEAEPLEEEFACWGLAPLGCP